MLLKPDRKVWTLTTIVNKASVSRFPVSALVVRCGMVAGLLLGIVASTFAQTRLKLSAIKPGTERVQLIYNGDFQFQGPVVGNNYPFPSGWSGSVDMYA